MKKTIYLLALLLAALPGRAQTWDGSASTDWNTAANWTPSGVPTATGNVVLPATAPNWPKLAANTTINSLSTSPGSQLDVAGKTLTLNGVSTGSTLDGLTLSNSNATNDISLHIGTLNTTGFQSYLRGCTINDHIFVYIEGVSGGFQEADASANTYNGNASFIVSNGSANFSLCSGAASDFNGNLRITRTAATGSGSTDVLARGATITGDFIFSDTMAVTTGAGATLGNVNFKTSIGDQIRLYYKRDTSGSANNGAFSAYRLVNTTQGGSYVYITTPGETRFQSDTLTVTELSVRGVKNNHCFITDNKITAINFSYADNPGASVGYSTYIRNNTFTGTGAGAHDFYINAATRLFVEADGTVNANTYNGNTIFWIYGGGGFTLGATSLFNNNLTVRHFGGTGSVNIFTTGAPTVVGNFTYTDTVSAASNATLGNVNNKTAIGGKVNISFDRTYAAAFNAYRLVNLTGGGIIDVNTPGGTRFEKDTLIVSSLGISGAKDAHCFITDNKITGNLSVADATAGSAYSTYIRNNTITGSSSFIGNGNRHMSEADGAGWGNTFNGNTAFLVKGSGYLSLGSLDSSTFNGNLGITRSAGTGYIDAFSQGAVITGNFTLIDTAATGSYTDLGNTAYKTAIGGKVNISFDRTNAAGFNAYRFVNLTGGGIIDVNTPGQTYFEKDTLIVSSLSISGAKDAHCFITDNKITGNLSVADNAGALSAYSTYIRNNTITGSSSFTGNGLRHMSEADGTGTGNTFNGNTAFLVKGSGYLSLGGLDSSTFNGNLGITRSAGTGYIDAFTRSAVITGNFTLIDTAATGSYTELGTTANKTAIGGTVTINFNRAATAAFSAYRLANQANGGTIAVNTPGNTAFQSDTLMVSSLGISGTHVQCLITDNKITGNLSVADDAGAPSAYSTSIRNNTFTGSSSFTGNGIRLISEADNAGYGNTYNGNLSITKNGTGAVNFAQGDTSYVSGSLTTTTNTPFTIGKLRFTGSTAAGITQNGTAPVSIATMMMDKTSGSTLTLNDSLMVTTNCTFINGNVLSSAGNELIFLNSATATGASDISKVVGPVSEIGLRDFRFPIGTPTSYNPATLSGNNAGNLTATTGGGTADKFTARHYYSSPATAGYSTALHDPAVQAVTHCEYWTINRDRGTGSRYVSLAVTDPCATGAAYTSNLSDLRVMHWNGTQWELINGVAGVGITSGTSTDGMVTSFQSTANYSPFTLGSVNATSSPLPVHLISFSAQKQGAAALLRWVTAQEQNSSSFDIERSNDGNRWSVIGTVAAAGNSTTTRNYAYTDGSPLNGMNYYRLNQKDADGKQTYSETRMVKFGEMGTAVSVYPNPATTYIKVISAKSIIAIESIDLAGKVVQQWKNSSTISLTSLAKGAYYLQIFFTDGSKETTKLIVQ